MKKHGLTGRQQRQLWRMVAGIENFWETLDEIEPGSVSSLAVVSTMAECIEKLVAIDDDDSEKGVLDRIKWAALFQREAGDDEGAVSDFLRKALVTVTPSFGSSRVLTHA